jgi:hypothetical protein
LAVLGFESSNTCLAGHSTTWAPVLAPGNLFCHNCNNSSNWYLGYSCLFFFFFFETGSCYVDQTGLNLVIFLPQPPVYWDYRYVLPVELNWFSFPFFFFFGGTGELNLGCQSFSINIQHQNK